MSTPVEPPEEPTPPPEPSFEAEPVPMTDAPPTPPPAMASPPPPAAPVYAQPGPERYPGPPPSDAKPNTWMNVVSLVTSILGLSVIGIIFGHMGVSQANKGRADMKGLGIAGLIIGYLALVATIAVVVAIIIFAANCDNIEGCTITTS